MLPRILSVTLFLFVCLFSKAQPSSAYSIHYYGTEEGLPSNGIKGLQWDRETGFLWIATEAGIVRYNGMNFKTYTSADDSHITNERILFLIRNNQGKIYAADIPGNIFQVTKNRLAFHSKKPINGNPHTNIISMGVSDRLYNADHKFENGAFTVQFGNIVPITDTSFLHRQYGKLYYFSISMKQPVALPLLEGSLGHPFKVGENIFLSDLQRNIWMLDKTSLKLSPVNFRLADGPTISNPAKNFWVWENGMSNTLFFNQQNAWKLDYINGEIVGSLICDAIPQDPLIRYVQYDEPTKTLFIGTDSKGIIVIRKKTVRALKKDRANPGERTSYYSQVELPNGNILTNEGHVFGKNPGVNSWIKGKFTPSTLLQGDSVFWFFQTESPNTSTALRSYNFRSGKLRVYPGITEQHTQTMMAFSGQHHYFANESGIFVREDDTLRKLYSYSNYSLTGINFDIKAIGTDMLVIATCNALLRYDIARNQLDTIFNAGNYCVRTIWPYKDYLFFGTYGNGIYVSKNGKVKALPLDKNQYLLYTHCFIEDKDGFVWLSTNRGLFRAKVSDLVNSFENNTDQIYYHYYGRNDGMEMTEMNGGCTPCGLVMKDQTMSFPTMEGLLWVNPDEATPVLPLGNIFIDELLINGKKTDADSIKKIRLSPNRNSLQIGLGFSAWGNKENIYLQYRLNESADWITINTDNATSIQFNNLSKGDYRLQIRKLNGFGPQNYSYKEIKFSVPTPWYESTWFYLLAVVFSGALIVMYFRYRTGLLKVRQRKLEKQVAEKTKELQEKNEVLEKNDTIKTRLISIISHDIVTPLKFLTTAGKNLQEKKQMMSEDFQQETLRVMTNTSQELQMLSTNILNWIKYQNENRRMMKEHFNLSEMVNQVLGLLQSLAAQKNLIIENKVDPNLEIHEYYEPMKILIYNLLTNAIHFTEKGSIEVDAARANGRITVFVKDQGVGMTPEQVQRILADEVVITSANVDNKKGHGLGFLIIKDLIKMMGATLNINSQKAVGTTIYIHLQENNKA